MSPSCVFVTACTVLVVCGVLVRETACESVNGDGSYQKTGDGGQGYSHDEGGDYASRMAGGSQSVPYATNAGSSGGQQYDSVAVGPSLFDQNTFSGNTNTVPHSGSAALPSSAPQSFFGTVSVNTPVQQPSFHTAVPKSPALAVPLNDEAWQRFDQPVTGGSSNFVSGGSFDHRNLGSGVGKNVVGGFNGGQARVNTLPAPKNLPAFSGRDSGVVYGNGGSVVGGGTGGRFVSNPHSAGVSTGLSANVNNLPPSLKTDFDQNVFQGDAHAFPDTLNKDIQVGFPTQPVIVGNLGANNAHQQAFNNVGNLGANSANVFTDGNKAFSTSANDHAKSVSFPSNPFSGSVHSTPNNVFSRNAFPLSGNSKVSSSGAFTSSKTQQVPTVKTSGRVQSNVFDTGVKSRGGAVRLNQDQINKLGRGSDLVNDLLNVNDVYGFDELDNLNVGGVFKQTGPHSNTGNVFGNKQGGSSKLGRGNVGGQLGKTQGSSISKELDVRSAALGFAGHSGGRSTLGSRGGGGNVHSGSGGVSSGGLSKFSGTGSGSRDPRSDFHVNLDVRGGIGRAGLKNSGALGGTTHNFGNVGRFNTPSGLGNKGRGSSIVNPYDNQVPFSRNVLPAQQSSNVGGGQLFKGSSLGTKTRGGLTGNVGRLGHSGASTSSFSGGLGNKQGVNIGNPDFSFGKQSFASAPLNHALNLGNTRLGSDFNRRGIKSGILNNVADSGLKSGRGSAFNQNRLVSSNPHALNRNQGFGNVAHSGFNTGRNSLNSGSKFSSSLPQSFSGNTGSSFGKGVSFGSSDGTGRGLGTIVGRSSKSSFSSSSSGSGKLGTGAFSGGNLGVGNSLTGVTFRGLDNLGKTGNAVVGSSRKVFDSGLVGTSKSVSGGGRQSYSSGTGSSSSGRSNTAYNSNDFGGDNTGSTHSGSSGGNANYANRGGDGNTANYDNTNLSRNYGENSQSG